jgi:hypothetical protein
MNGVRVAHGDNNRGVGTMGELGTMGIVPRAKPTPAPADNRDVVQAPHTALYAAIGV